MVLHGGRYIQISKVKMEHTLSQSVPEVNAVDVCQLTDHFQTNLR